MKVTYGADPEFFVLDKATKTIIPSCGLFGGDKGSPILLSKEGGYLEDGVTIEINVAPKSGIDDLIKSINGLKSLWEQRFPQHELVTQACAEFKKADLRKHRQAMEIGCNADACAWGIRRTPQISDFGPHRFAGGHIHIGLDPWPVELEKDFLIRWLDVFALMPTIHSSNQERFRHYGRPGLWRSTPYGVEWRSPDSSWTNGQNKIAEWTEFAIEKLQVGLKKWEGTKARFNALLENEGMAERLSRPVMDHWGAWPYRWSQNTSKYMDAVVRA